MSIMDRLLGRSDTSHTSPKSVIRKVADTRGEYLTQRQIDMLLAAIAVATLQLRKKVK